MHGDDKRLRRAIEPTQLAGPAQKDQTAFIWKRGIGLEGGVRSIG